MSSAHDTAAAERFTAPGAWRHGLRYGLLGLPLAFVALPLYVILPNHYARNFAVPLAALGAVLLAARLFDAVLDPLIGRWTDRLFARSHRAVLAAGAAAAGVLALGLWGLLFPPAAARADITALLVWAGVAFGLIFFARELRFSFFGWPFSFWMAAQGSLLVYGLIIAYYAWAMNRLDREHGVQEPTE